MTLLSRSQRIVVLLGLNIVVFLTEIIVGYKTGSLALIADAFHMLSDVLSQIIALYAIRLAAKTKWQSTLSYGWQRAELLGALYNGVFLLALCFSIFLDAIERFFKPEDIENPQLVLIVGGIGLACNLLGLFLFHEHSGHGHGHGHSHGHSHSKAVHDEKKAKMDSGEEKPNSGETLNNQKVACPENTSEKRPHNFHYESSLERISPLKEANLQNLQRAALDVQKQLDDEERHDKGKEIQEDPSSIVVISMDEEDRQDNHKHDGAAHQSESKKSKSPGQDLNMQGIFLHVLGDALGSVGVIFSAMFVWKTNLSWRFYMDPIISLLIVAIIVHTALPLVRSASFILMQGVPVGVEIEEIRKEIKAIPDVISIHDLHIWQLTNIKMVASLHVLVTNQEAFERVSRAVKTIMHRAGVHSTTIQPEFPGMHPHLSQMVANAKRKSGLKLRRIASGDDADGLLQTNYSTRTDSIGAQSDDFLPGRLKGSVPAQDVNSANASPPSSTVDVSNNTGDFILTQEEQDIMDKSNCALLCVNGEQTCNVGNCCTLPVKR
ncbi:hypothetical protein BX616_009878 [Lobosporangium transversale]|uniref:Cation efflux family-domain-containing protein n=1 Tax=Lobosporangium transversale TaxID=64571 RepID=A0A1Y2GJW4_9FUNG|nr:cation efflux family-domain-containing protein [Lobosporangium transversale]KAF9913563.1 hypothetical protein BX616_009878 [Lobosporangium transversale]ORZ13320.1 cation efflux family-domain-containing protein [Lobosporangium transversale]|eukprot:XP_021880401.1 cation efflux family-domain-containing protein [Lobosporangium transversale]